MLELRVDGCHYVLAGNGFLVHLPVLVAAFYPVPGVAQVYLIAFLSLEIFFAGGLYACLADVVSGLVCLRMAPYVICADFGYVAEKISSGIVRIVPYVSGLSPESGEFIRYLGEFHEYFRRQMREHCHRPVADFSPVAVVSVHLFPEEFRCYLQDFAQGQGVEFPDFLRGDEHVVCHLVADEDFPVPVIDYSPRRVNDGMDHRIVGCVNLVLVVDYLDDKES